jgi:hypothetical protein
MFKSYILYCKIFKRTLLFLHYCIALCPNVETLSLHKVIALYSYRFGNMCTSYRFVPLSLQENFFFSLYIFMGFCVYVCTSAAPQRPAHTVLCHPRWLPTSGLTEFAVCWGGAGFEPRTTDLQSGALPLSHLSSLKLSHLSSLPLSHLSSLQENW